MRILMCGDREWTDKSLIRIMLHKYASSEPVIIHGGARGADSIAGEIAEKELGLEVLVFPAQWDKHGKAAGPIRNQQMLDEGKPDLVIAFHNHINESKGTKDMLKRARKAGIKCLLVTFGGTHLVK